jgi:DNA-binding response OmpR family regulator
LNGQQTIRLAVIDDDSGFVTVLSKRTEMAGWQQRLQASAIPPEELLAMKLNALLVDVRVLGDDAWSYLDRVCEMLPELGVIVCTGQSTVAQRVRALRLGVDDWIGKPCHPEEAMARIEAVSRRRRRSRAGADAQPVLAGELEIRGDRFQAFADGRSLDLTRREFELLLAFLRRPRQVLRREELLARVWGYDFATDTNVVEVYVLYLRRKLEAAGEPRLLHTVRGAGYILRDG